MAKKKVSQLTAAASVGKADLIHVVQGGTSKKATGAMFLLQESAVADLGLKQAAFKDVGTGATQVSAGNHGHGNDAGLGGPFTLAGVDNSPVGLINFFPRIIAPVRYIKANGALLSRAAFPALWAEVVVSGNYVTEATWYSGQYGSYSIGDGYNTFRIPMINGYVLRAWDDGAWIDPYRAMGSAQADTIQNITGVFNSANSAYANIASGAFGIGGTGYTSAGDTSGGQPATFFDASRVVRTSSETRMKNIALLACIKYI